VVNKISVAKNGELRGTKSRRNNFVGPLVLVGAMAVMSYGLTPHAPIGWGAIPPTHNNPLGGYTPSGRDAVPLYSNDNGHSHYLRVALGSENIITMLDTGATELGPVFS
jgi:hypothetical protein